MNVEIKLFLRAKFEGLQCPPPPPQDPQVSGTIGTKITLTSNSGEGHNCLVYGIREGHNFLCRCIIFYVIIFQSYNISEFATLPPLIISEHSLIGSDQMWQFFSGQKISGKSGVGPVAFDTSLGWVLSGPVEGKHDPKLPSATNFVETHVLFTGRESDFE